MAQSFGQIALRCKRRLLIALAAVHSLQGGAAPRTSVVLAAPPQTKRANVAQESRSLAIASKMRCLRRTTDTP